MLTGPERFISQHLTSRPNDDVCDTCLAKHTGLTDTAVHEQVTLLARTPLYLRDVWTCADCGERGTVTRAIANRA